MVNAFYVDVLKCFNSITYIEI